MYNKKLHRVSIRAGAAKPVHPKTNPFDQSPAVRLSNVQSQGQNYVLSSSALYLLVGNNREEEKNRSPECLIEERRGTYTKVASRKLRYETYLPE